MMFSELHEAHEKLEKERDTLLAELYFQESEVPEIVNGLKSLKSRMENVIKELDEKQNEIVDEIESMRSQITAEAGDIIEKLRACENCEKTQNYIEILRIIHEKNCIILLSLEEEECDWNLIVEKLEEMEKILTFVKESKCKNFVAFLDRLVFFWKEKIRKELEKSIGNLINEMGWPLQSMQMPMAPLAAPSAAAPKEAAIFQRLQLFVKLYSKIFLVPEKIFGNKFDPEISVVPIFFSPFLKRFEFHFFGDSQTNSIEKPEWFFTQILTWIKLHRDILIKIFQPIFEKKNENIFIQFSRALVGLAARRLKTSLL